MVSKWALAASFFLALAATGDAHAQTATTWDRKAEPLEGRPGEYRTTSTDTWIRLTPYLGGQIFDGGLRLTPGPVLGLALEFDPADILIASIDINGNVNAWKAIAGMDPGAGWGAAHFFSFNREGAGQGSPGNGNPGGDQELAGRAWDLSLYMGLKNPELKTGALQPIIGLGIGAWNLSGYDTSLSHTVPVEGPAGDTGVPGGGAPVKIPTQWVPHATIFLRLDFDVSEHVKFGFNFKNHFIVYATKQDLGNMIHDKFKMDNIHFAFEPDMYLSFTF